VGFPSNRLPVAMLKEILQGAQDKAKEAGVSIIGGHTVDDTEPKFGLAVTGLIHPERVLTNASAKAGDALILTKPIGLGIITTAIKRGLADDSTIKYAIAIMSTLNRRAAEVMENFPVTACTDVTGFGLLGHLKEMARASGVNAEIFAEEVPTLAQAWDFAVANVVPGGTLNNLEYISESVTWAQDISQTTKLLLCDAQTSGGLLIAVPDEFAAALLKKLQSNGIPESALIGKFTKAGIGNIVVRKTIP
ncbi:MAG: selenide, water dikinase SelD, partial [bacterium]